MKRIKIFLASSNELKSDRDQFEIRISRKNKPWIDKNISLHLERWEDRSALMSPTRSQDEYNEAIKECDLFVLLIHKKVGIYSEEEFDNALESFKIKGKPRLIIYFKEEFFSTDNRDDILSLWKFKDRLNKLGYFPPNYKNTDSLWNQFNNELESLYNIESNIVEYDKIRKILENPRLKTNNTIDIRFNNSLDKKILNELLSKDRTIDELKKENQNDTNFSDLEKLNYLQLAYNGIIKKGSFLAIGLRNEIMNVCKYANEIAFNIYSRNDTNDEHISVKIKGNLIQQYNEAMNLLMDNLNIVRYPNKNLDDYEIPKLVLREIIANALIHTNYISDNGMHTKIELFKDRLEINNFGKLSNYFDLEDPQSYLKKPSVAGVFYLFGIVEKSGTGIKRAKSLLSERNMYPLKIEQKKGYVKVIIFRKQNNTDKKNQFNEGTFNLPKFINYKGNKILKTLGYLPVNPSAFIGRENMTKEIHNRLKNGENLLLVNGVGGIGKTTMASQYYFEYREYYKHLIWLVSEKGIKEAILSLALPLELSFPNELTSLQQIEEIIRYISDLAKPILLVIDNANDLHDLNENYQLLRKFNQTDILITSRIDTYQNIDTFKVNHLDAASANELFKLYYKAFKLEEQALLDKVLIAIGYNTLVIELLAKNLHEFNTGLKEYYTLQKLLEDIQEKGVLAISKSVEIYADYTLEVAKPEDIIRSIYDISPLSEAEKQLLSIFAVLPATSIPFSDLEQFLPNIEMLDRVALKLSQKGWLDYDKALQSFKTNPIISEIAREQNEDRLEVYINTLVLFLINKLNYEIGSGHIEGDFEDIKKMVSYAETFVHNFEVSNHNKSIVFDRLGNFYKTYGNLDKALQFFEEYLKLTKELNKSNPKNMDIKNSLAISYSKLGETHTALGNLDKALQFFEDNLKLNVDLHKSNPEQTDYKNNLAISYEKLGEVHTELGNLDKALMFFENYLKLMKELYESNPIHVGFKNDLAISYGKLGEIHNALGNLDKALQFFEDEIKLFEELYESHPTNVAFKNGLAISYSKLGETHTALGNLDKALQFFEDYLKLTKELYESNPTHVAFKNGFAISYSKLGETHTALGNLDKALQFFEDYLKLTKELYESNPTHVAFKNGLAVSYSKLGDTYIELGNLEKALEFFEQKLKLSKELYENNPEQIHFKNGLAVSCERLGDIYSRLGNLEKALEFFEKDLKLTKDLYESHPTHVDFKNGLAIAYEKLGNTHTALGNLDKALPFFEDYLKLRKELYESHPTHVAFKNGLAVSYIKLGELYTDQLHKKEEGIPYLQKALVIWEELTTNFPSYVEFQNNYTWIINKLKSLEES